MNENLKYRIGIDADVPQLVSIGLLAYGQYKDRVTEGNWIKMKEGLGYENTYIKLLEIATCIVCECQDKIIGMVFLVHHGNPTPVFQYDWAYIRMLGVHPEFEGRGIGRMLTQMCINQARQNGEGILALHTSEFQNAARHIYEDLGFVKVRDIDKTFGIQYYLYTLGLNNENGGINYLRANVNDVAILVENRLLFAKEFSGDIPEDILSQLRVQMTDYFRTATETGACVSYIAFCGNEVAGIGSFTVREQPGNMKNPSGKWAYIMNMFTLPQHRRKGICTGILNGLVTEAEKMGISALELHATKVGEMVYTQNGFELHNEPTYRKYVKL